MRRFIVFTILTNLSIGCFAQDIIVKKDGSVIQAKVSEIGTSEVKYKKWSNQDGPSYAIAKSDILAITYQNGEKESFETTPEKQQVNVTNIISLNDYVSTQQNVDAINSINNAPFGFCDEKFKQKKQNAKHLGIQYGIAASSVIKTDLLSVNFEFGRLNYPGTDTERHLLVSDGLYYYKQYGSKLPYLCPNGRPTVSVKVTNTSDRILYIDLANSFISKGEHTEPFYVPSATTTSNTSTSGGAFNLGGITNGLGIGGVVGSLANATTIGGSNGTTTSNVVFSQRIVSIPPHSMIMLPYKLIDNTSFLYSRRNTNIHNHVTHVTLDRKIYLGEEIAFEENNSPLKFTVFLTSSYSEEFKEKITLTTMVYCKKLVGLGSADGYSHIRMKDFDFSQEGMYSIGKF